MSPKKNKPKKPSTTKPKDWPWSQLPPNHPRSLYAISCYPTTVGTTKSWRPTRCGSAERRDRWPQLQHLVDDAGDGSAARNTPFWGAHNRYLDDATRIQDLPKELLASYWCVLKADNVTRPYSPPALPSPSSYFERLFLGWVRLAGNGAVLSSSLLAQYEIRTGTRYDSVWIRYECATADPFDADNKYMEFTSLVQCGGKVYAVSLQGALVVMEDVDSRLRITATGAGRVVPSVNSRFFKEYLVEMNQEIFLVFVIHQKSRDFVDEIEVFRLCFADLKWIRVERLEEKTLFVHEKCYRLNSARIGCRENCVYFTQGSDASWWLYDMEKSCISPV